VAITRRREPAPSPLLVPKGCKAGRAFARCISLMPSLRAVSSTASRTTARASRTSLSGSPRSGYWLPTKTEFNGIGELRAQIRNSAGQSPSRHFLLRPQLPPERGPFLFFALRNLASKVETERGCPTEAAYIAYNRIPIAPTDKARTAKLIASIQSNRAIEWAWTWSRLSC
jgi:hypothetical protein